MAGYIGQLLMPDIAGSVFDGIKQGEQYGQQEIKQKTLAQYVQPALSGDQGALSKIYGVDPDAGMKVQQQAGVLHDDAQKRLGEFTRTVANLAQSGDLSAASQYYSANIGAVQRDTGMNLGDKLDPGMIPHIKQVADAFNPQKADYVKGSPGDVFFDTSGSGKPSITIPGDKAPPQSIQELQYLQKNPDLLGVKERLAMAGRQPRQPSDIERKLELAKIMGASPEQLKQMVLGSAGTNGAPDVPGDQKLSGDAYLKTIDQQTAAQVKALDDGRMAFPTGTALKSPYWQGMLGAVSQYDPGFDAINFNSRSSTRKGFTSGKEAQTVNSLNTVAEHLGTLSDYADQLNNTSIPLVNRIKNFTAQETGDPRIARFNTAKKAAADEVAKVWRSTGGSEADIQENLKNLDGAQSPQQLHAAIGTLVQLIGGKLSALQDQYKQGMGTEQNAKPLVSPEAQKAFHKVLQRAGVQSAPEFNSTPTSSSDDNDPLGLLK